MAEPYHSDPHKTLLSYLAHVSLWVGTAYSKWWWWGGVGWGQLLLCPPTCQHIICYSSIACITKQTINSKYSHLIVLHHQIDTKGIPSIINSHVLKRHPMAISKIRKNFERKASREECTHSSSVTSLSSSPTHSYKSGRYYDDPLQVGHYVTGSSS